MAKLRSHSAKPVFIMRKTEHEPDGARTTFFECVRSDRKILWRWTRYRNGRFEAREKYTIKSRLIKPYKEAMLTYQMNGWFIEFKDDALIASDPLATSGR